MRRSATATFALMLALPALMASASLRAEAPARVARLLETQGAVSLAPADTDSWDEAERNRPVVYGDRLETGPAGRAALEFDAGMAFLDQDSALVWEGDDAGTALALDYGTARVDLHATDAQLALRTPDLTFTPDEAGSYRLDVDPGRGETVITVYAGAGTVHGRGGRRTLSAAQAYRFSGGDLDYTGLPLRGRDDFDAWAGDLADRFGPYADDALPDGLVGYRELHGYGDWDDSPEYGRVWYPRVDDGWAPYRSGYWRYIAPWGWTWMDAAPWGFAPFHYGRWVVVDHHHHHHHRRRWGWVPGPRGHRACYAPALVGFGDGGGHQHHGAPIGWFPLGPRDIYRPAWRSRDDHYLRLNAPATRWHSPAALHRARHRHDGLEHYSFGRQAPAWTLADHDGFRGGHALRTRPGDARTIAGLRAAPAVQVAPPPRGPRHGRRADRPDRTGRPDAPFERGNARGLALPHGADADAVRRDARGAARTGRHGTERGGATAAPAGPATPGAPAGSATPPAPTDGSAARASRERQRYGQGDGLRTDAVPRGAVSTPAGPDRQSGNAGTTARPRMPARWQPGGGQASPRGRDGMPRRPQDGAGSAGQAAPSAAQTRPAPGTPTSGWRTGATPARAPLPARWQAPGEQPQDRSREAAPARPDRQTGSAWQQRRNPREAQAPATRTRPAPASADRADRRGTRAQPQSGQPSADRAWASPSPATGGLRAPARERPDAPAARSAPARQGGWAGPSRDDRSGFGSGRSASGHDRAPNAGRPDSGGRADPGSAGRRDEGRASFAPRGGGSGRDGTGQPR